MSDKLDRDTLFKKLRAKPENKVRAIIPIGKTLFTSLPHFVFLATLQPMFEVVSKRELSSSLLSDQHTSMLLSNAAHVLRTVDNDVG